MYKWAKLENQWFNEQNIWTIGTKNQRNHCYLKLWSGINIKGTCYWITMYISGETKRTKSSACAKLW